MKEDEFDFKTNKMKLFSLNNNGTWDLSTTIEIGSDAYYQVINDRNTSIID